VSLVWHLPQALAAFVAVLETHGIGATPRVRRGIDIDAGCGQLSTKRKKHDEKEERRRAQQPQSDTGAGTFAEAADAASAYASTAADETSAELRRVAAAAMARGAQPSEAAVAGGW
jgi:hypothetical protein